VHKLPSSLSSHPNPPTPPHPARQSVAPLSFCPSAQLLSFSAHDTHSLTHMPMAVRE
jgi:hypothetical protein